MASARARARPAGGATDTERSSEVVPMFLHHRAVLVIGATAAVAVTALALHASAAPPPGPSISWASTPTASSQPSAVGGVHPIPVARSTPQASGGPLAGADPDRGDVPAAQQRDEGDRRRPVLDSAQHRTCPPRPAGGLPALGDPRALTSPILRRDATDP